MPLNFLNYKIRAYFRSDQTGLIITLGCERISIDEKQPKWTLQGALIRFFVFLIPANQFDPNTRPEDSNHQISPPNVE